MTAKNIKNVEFYWLPNCSTCQKAKSFVESNSVVFDKLRDIKGEKLSRREIELLAEKCGGVSQIFSKRAVKYRELKLNERELSNEEMIGFMTEEYTFIKRPVLIVGEKGAAGFSEKSYLSLINES